MISVHVNFLLYVDIVSHDMKKHYFGILPEFDYTAITTAMIQGLAYKKIDIFIFLSNRIFHRNYHGNVVDISGNLLLCVSNTGKISRTFT